MSEKPTVHGHEPYYINLGISVCSFAGLQNHSNLNYVKANKTFQYIFAMGKLKGLRTTTQAKVVLKCAIPSILQKREVLLKFTSYFTTSHVWTKVYPGLVPPRRFLDL